MPKHIPKWIRILVPSVLLVVWLVLGAVGGPYFGKIKEVSSNDQSTFLPASAESTAVREKVEKFQDTTALPAIIVFNSSNKEKNLDDSSVKSVNLALESIKSSTPAVVSTSPAILAEDNKAIIGIINIDADSDTTETTTAIKKHLSEINVGLNYKISGPAGFLGDLAQAFAGIDGLLLGVALIAVFIILLFVYRSPILPFIVLLNSIFALCAAILVVFYLAKADIVTLNGQVQGILFILVVGAATDYALLLVARYKEELIRRQDSSRALMASWKRSFEPILAAGGTVIAGLLCLLLSDLNSNKALGPVGAIGIIAAILSALTLLPALLSLFGRRAFWPFIPQYSKVHARSSANKQHGIWARVARFVKKQPRIVWFTTIALLGIASMGLLQLKADGVAQSELILGYSEAREGQKLIKEHFPGGSGTPIQVVVPANRLENAVTILEQDKSITSVSTIAENSPSGTMPVGSYKKELRGSIRDEISKEFENRKKKIGEDILASSPGAPRYITDQIYAQATASIPSIDELTDQAYPFSKSTLKVIDGNVVLEATPKDSPDSEAARQTVERLRKALDSVDSSVIVGGVTAVQLDTIKSAERDRSVIIPTVLIVITIILMFLLRSVAAPILLLFTTVLSFAAAIGVSAILFNHIWEFPGADPSVILFGFIFLVALGIDYNIFLMTRVREESITHGTRAGMTNGLVVTGGVITSAGVVLAATFAALAVIPILFLVQLAFIVAFGVLLDTIIIRSLLVPALVLDIGSRVWWPFGKKIKE